MVLFLPISLLANDAWDYENTGGWGFKLRGSYKNLFIYQEKKEVGADLQRVRLSPKITYGEDFVFYVVMHTLCRNSQTTFLFSTHDPMVMDRSERLIHLVDGKIAGDEVRCQD